MRVEEREPGLGDVDRAGGDLRVVLGGAGEPVGLRIGGDAGPRVAHDLRAQLRHHGAGGFTERNGEDGHEDDEERGTLHVDRTHLNVDG